MNKLYPNSFNIELASQKGLIVNNQISEKYIKLQEKYRFYFKQYLYEDLNLPFYDNIINKSDLKFGICSDEKKDYYQKQSNLKYIYIKNNMHIEKLDINDLELLENNNEKDILVEMIKRTYTNIIKINTLNNKKCPNKFRTQMFEGFNTNKTILPNDSLILVIREGDAKNNLTGESFKENLKQKYNFINDLISKMEKDFNDKLKCSIDIIHLLR